MAACDFLRMIGILTHFLCVILFLVAMGTVNWTNVKHFSGEAGLWQYCNLHMNDSTSDESTGISATGSSSTTSSFGRASTTQSPVASNDEDDDDDDDELDQCHSFGVIHIDSYLHFVRLLIILALFCFAYGFCKGTTIRVKIEYDPRFARQHLGELLSLSGAIMAMLAMQVYGQSYNSDGTILPYLKGRQGPNGEQDGDLLELGWSIGLLEGSMITLIPAVILMMMPTLSEKCGWCNGTSRSNRGRSSSNSESRFAALRRDFRSDPLHSLVRFVSGPRPSGAQPRRASEPEISNRVELSMRRHSLASTISDGSIFTISDSRTERRVGDTTEPAPHYEDLAPLPLPTPSAPSGDHSLMPPPPSYDDVLKGLYATTSPQGSSLVPPPPYTDSPPPVVSSASPVMSAPPATQSQDLSLDDTLSRTSSLLPPGFNNDNNLDISAPTHAPIAFEDFTSDTHASTSHRAVSSSSSSISSSSINEEISVSNSYRTRSRSVSPGSGRRSRSISPP